MKIEFLGHAGICIKTNNSKIVMDGWFTKNGAFDGAWYQFPENHDYMKHDWSDITAAIVSHEHMDHLDPEFLSILPENVPIFIPNNKNKTASFFPEVPKRKIIFGKLRGACSQS